jgi:SRSO17 transposase
LNQEIVWLNKGLPDANSVSAQSMLKAAQWRKVSWRTGTRSHLTARFATVRIRGADGLPQRICDTGAQHLPGEEVWLVGEHRLTGERKYYLSNHPANTSLKPSKPLGFVNRRICSS